jgi:hypothetical protein
MYSADAYTEICGATLVFFTFVRYYPYITSLSYKPERRGIASR